MNQKMYLTILRVGVYCSLIPIFFVFKNLLFPFITSKQLPFNIIVEVLFAIWVGFIIKYPEYRPKMSWITLSLGGFMAAMTISSITGVDFNLSFWGDVERMLGVFHIIHFFLLYLIMITVFREWKEWKTLFILSVAFSMFISFYSISTIAYSTIGNTAYVSGYLIFNIYFAILLFAKEENKGLRWIYLIALPIQFMAMKEANTSGAFVGLGFSVIVFTFLYGALHKNKKIKIAFLTCFFILSAFTGYTFLINRENIVTNNVKILGRIVRGLDLKKDTFQTRLISWRAAIKDFKAHPITGTGHGNYAITFDKYFDPSFYDYTRRETYFDRAHNNVIDIATTSGLVGLITYLTIFGAVAYYLMRVLYEKKISVIEFSIITSLLTAYFVQNLAVFDSFVTYLSLMAVLSYIYWLDKNHEYETPVKDRVLENKEIYALAGAGLLMLLIIFQYNIKPWKMLIGTIDGQRAWASGDLEATTDKYKEALNYETVLDRDSRTSYIRIMSGNPSQLRQMPKDKAMKIIDYSIELADINVKFNPGDSMNQMMLAQLLNMAASYSKDNQEKFEYYSQRALEAIDKSIEASPGRVPIYFQKAQIYITRGEKDKTLETLKYAVGLNDDYYDSHCHYGRTLLFYGDKEDGYAAIGKCIDKGGAELLAPAGFVKGFIDHYTPLEDWQKLTRLWVRMTNLEPNKYEHRIELAKVYEKTGKYDLAIAAAEKALELNPTISDYVNDFIVKIEGMKADNL